MQCAPVDARRACNATIPTRLHVNLGNAVHPIYVGQTLAIDDLPPVGMANACPVRQSLYTLRHDLKHCLVVPLSR